MATQRVDIVITSSGTVQVTKDIEDIGRASENSAGGVDILKGALAAIVSAQTFNAFANLTSAFTDYNSRVAQATDGSLSASDAMGRLYDMAQRTYSTFDNTAEIFLQNSEALKGLGLSTKQQLDYTEALNNALVVSGTKGERAEAVIQALSDSMALGSLEGQQLQTVLKGSSEVTALLAKELGTTADKLLIAGRNGEITSGIIYNSLVRNFDLLQQKAEDMPATIEDGMARIKNALFYTIGLWDQNAQISSTFASVLVTVSDNMKILLVAISPVAVALSALAVQIIGTQVINGFNAMMLAITQTGKALLGLYSIILANPLTALVVAAAAAFAAIISYTVGWEQALQSVINAINTASQLLKGFLSIFGATFSNGQWEIKVTGEELINGIKTSIDEGKRKLYDGITSGADAGGETFKRKMKEGGADAAAEWRKQNEAWQEEQQKRAIARYEEMNGKAVKIWGDKLIEGGKYIYNEIDGSIRKAAPELKKNIEEGGINAGKAIGTEMEKAGNNITYNLSSTMSDILVGFTAFNTELLSTMNMITRYLNATIDKIMAEANKLNAEAAKLKQEANKIRQDTYGSGGSGGGGGGGSGGGGGGVTVSKSPTHDSILASYYAEQEKLQARKDAQMAPSGKVYQAAGGGGTSYGAPAGQAANVNVGITNVVDPSATLSAIDTQAGHNQILNVIATNREQVQSILGWA